VEGLAFCLVFCSTLAAIVSVLPVLCSLNCVPNMVGVYGPPLTIWFGLRHIWRDPTLVLLLPSLKTCIGTCRPPLLINQSPRAPCSATTRKLEDWLFSCTDCSSIVAWVEMRVVSYRGHHHVDRSCWICVNLIEESCAPGFRRCFGLPRCWGLPSLIVASL
jgi:hypothetical protein